MIASSLSSDLRDTPVKKLFWKYTLPTIIAIMVNGLYTIIDGFFIGHYIGEAGLAGLNVLWALISLLVGAGTMIGMASSSLFSIEKGLRRRPKLFGKRLYFMVFHRHCHYGVFLFYRPFFHRIADCRFFRSD